MAFVTRAPANYGAQPLGSYSTFPQAALGSAQAYPGTFQFVASAPTGYNTATAPTMYNLPTMPSLVPTPTQPQLAYQAPVANSEQTRPDEFQNVKPKAPKATS